MKMKWGVAGAFSEGARYERKAVLAKVRREMRSYNKPLTELEEIIIRDLLGLESWLLDRRKRYESKPGGLGRKKI